MNNQDNFNGILPLKARLSYPEQMHFFSEFRQEHLNNELEAIMFLEYFQRRYVDKNGWPHMKHLKTKKPFFITSENVGEVFSFETLCDPEYFLKFDFSKITIRSYADKLSDTVGDTREAYFTIIFVMDDKVTINVSNTYKYEEWDEIIAHLFCTFWETNSEERIPGIWFKRGLRKAYVLLTNVDTFRPIFSLYEDVAAGFIVDREHNDLTILDPLSAIFIHHELFHLCEQQTTYSYSGDGHSGPKRYYDDSMLETSKNPYVIRFRELLEQYQTGFDIEKAIKDYFRLSSNEKELYP